MPGSADGLIAEPRGGSDVTLVFTPVCLDGSTPTTLPVCGDLTAALVSVFFPILDTQSFVNVTSTRTLDATACSVQDGSVGCRFKVPNGEVTGGCSGLVIRLPPGCMCVCACVCMCVHVLV